jgi:hypothetical protein
MNSIAGLRAPLTRARQNLQSAQADAHIGLRRAVWPMNFLGRRAGGLLACDGLPFVLAIFFLRRGDQPS